MGFGYPGGPKVDNLAKTGIPNIDLPIANIDNLDFSFSGIKTAVINLNHKNPNLNKADLCASFQKAATKMLLNNVEKVVGENVSVSTSKINKIVLAGGVSANSYIRNEFDNLSKEKGIEVLYPELKYCTDNAAMIACAGYYNFLENKKADLKLNAIPNLKLEE